MKGGGILGGIGGLLGLGLLSKGAMRGGVSLLGSLASGLSGGRGGMGGGRGGMGGGRGGMDGGRRGGGSCGRGGRGDDVALPELLQQAYHSLTSQPKAQAVTAGPATNALPEGQSREILDVSAVRAAPADTDQHKAALILLTSCLVSYLPGRARLRHQRIREESAWEGLRGDLLQAGFQEVTFNASTGSVLLTWDAAVWNKAAFLAAALPLGLLLLGSNNAAVV